MNITSKADVKRPSESPKEAAASTSPELADISCQLCHNVLFEPVTVEGKYNFCKRCILTHFAVSPLCPVTGVELERERAIKLRDDILTGPINKELEDKINAKFPMYTMLRERLQGASEKRWWFDLHEKRSNLEVLRDRLIEARKQKLDALEKLKQAFCNFVKSCKKETAYKKEFEREHALLAKRQECAKSSVPLTKERCEAFASLPGQCCCLRALLNILEDALLKGPDHLTIAHERLTNVFLGKETLPPCPECGGNILSQEDRKIDCENSVRDEIGKLTDKFEGLFTNGGAMPSTSRPLEVTPVVNNKSTMNHVTTEDKYGLSSETILMTCAKLFGQNGELESKKTLAALAQTHECDEADSDEDFLECCAGDNEGEL